MTDVDEMMHKFTLPHESEALEKLRASKVTRKGYEMKAQKKLFEIEKKCLTDAGEMVHKFTPPHESGRLESEEFQSYSEGYKMKAQKKTF